MCAITRTLATAVLLHMALCMDIPAPVHLVLSSQYFNHLLSWEKGPGSPDGVHFSVIIRTLSGRKVVVKECENVTSPLRCNLTEAFSDVEETYYASVYASLGKHTSYSHCQPFKPILNTTVLEPPLLSVAACNRSLCVSLRAPVEKLASVYDSHQFRYRLVVSSEDGVEFTVGTEGLRSVTLKDLAPGRRYCVNVSIVDRNTTRRDPVCADIPHTADDVSAHVSDVVVSVVLFLLTLLLLMCSPRLISLLFCLKPPLPAVLSSIKSGNKVLLFTPAELINTLFEVQKTKSCGEEEEDEEESVRCERIVQYLDTRGSSLLIFPVSSSCGSSGDARVSLGSSTGAHSLTVFEDGRVQTPAAAQETSPLTHETPHTHEEDGESAADVNLLSVTIRGASAEPHDSCSVLDELGLSPQNLLLTDPHTLSSSGRLVSEEEEEEEGYEGEEGDEEEEEDSSGYLSRN